MSGPAALVTGSSRGIGLAIAVELAREGFALALNAPIADAELTAAVEALRAEGGTVTAAAFDVAEIAGHDAALARAEAEIGPLSTLVNNAGVGVLARGDLLEVSAESFDRCMAVNARAPFFLAQAFARRLLARERDATLFHSIVNVTSSNAVAVAVERGEYCASKAAAAMISKVFAVRLGAENVAVYDVQPGVIETAMTAPVIETYRERAAAGLTLMPRIGQPEEVGRIVAALAMGRLPYTTGQTISADAGMLVPRF
jgi:NAD(P)-dependent dehydrogenase (short-subunit alcohol dehydrogenase family)